jgi:hypothetical protein
MAEQGDSSEDERIFIINKVNGRKVAGAIAEVEIAEAAVMASQDKIFTSIAVKDNIDINIKNTGVAPGPTATEHTLTQPSSEKTEEPSSGSSAISQNKIREEPIPNHCEGLEKLCFSSSLAKIRQEAPDYNFNDDRVCGGPKVTTVRPMKFRFPLVEKFMSAAAQASLSTFSGGSRCNGSSIRYDGPYHITKNQMTCSPGNSARPFSRLP